MQFKSQMDKLVYSETDQDSEGSDTGAMAKAVILAMASAKLIGDQDHDNAASAIEDIALHISQFVNESDFKKYGLEEIL